MTIRPDQTQANQPEVEISVTGIVQIFKETQEQPGNIWIWSGPIWPKQWGGYLNELMGLEGFDDIQCS